MNNENKRITFYIVFIFLLVGVTVLLLEIILRFLPDFLEEPQKGLFDEARRITFSNTRVFPGKQVGGPAIKLPDQSSSGILVIGDSFPFGWLVDKKNILQSIKHVCWLKYVLHNTQNIPYLKIDLHITVNDNLY